LKNGSTVAAFEREFAAYVGAQYAIALCNGTATLHTALVALGVNRGDRVAVPPLTMSSTTIAVLHAGAVPVFVDVDPDTWIMQPTGGRAGAVSVPVSLYGLHQPYATCTGPDGGPVSYVLDDAAQTLRKMEDEFGFTSYSFQASKILALGEGGMLVTDTEELATKAREFSSLGYRMRADQPRIDPDALKSPTFDRHYSLGWNYRMNDRTAALGLTLLGRFHFAGHPLDIRAQSTKFYRDAIVGCDWLTPQRVPEGWTHDYWTFAVASDTPERAARLADAIVTYGGERPYPAWRLTYDEPAFKHLHPAMQGFAHSGFCPVAESLQPRLLQFQTNNLASAERNAVAVRRAIEDLSA
jgi:perosamine synthetase